MRDFPSMLKEQIHLFHIKSLKCFSCQSYRNTINFEYNHSNMFLRFMPVPDYFNPGINKARWHFVHKMKTISINDDHNQINPKDTKIFYGYTADTHLDWTITRFWLLKIENKSCRNLFLLNLTRWVILIKLTCFQNGISGIFH